MIMRPHSPCNSQEITVKPYLFVLRVVLEYCHLEVWDYWELPRFLRINRKQFVKCFSNITLITKYLHKSKIMHIFQIWRNKSVGIDILFNRYCCSKAIFPILNTALIWSAKNSLTALLEDICATLNLCIQALKLSHIWADYIFEKCYFSAIMRSVKIKCL